MNTAFYRVSGSVLALLSLAACKALPMPTVPGVTPYRMVIQQGNYISQEMVSQLKPGMTKEQVRFVLGTPLVTDIFHADRWDYVYFREAEGKKEQRNLSVIFEKERLARVIGDLMPSDATPPQATGFKPLVKPEPEPAAKPAAKPAAEAAAKPAPDAPKPAAPAASPAAKPAEGWEPTKQNWSSAPPEPEKKPAAAEAAKAPEKQAEEKKAEDKERGFFGRMLEKIGL